ncbi:MAG: hypothetical protein ACR2OO_15295 [Thermomicrobiales bacterium]
MLDALGRIARCITDRPVLAGGYRPIEASYSVTFAPRGFPVPLGAKDGRRGVGLLINHYYRVVHSGEESRRGWEVQPTGYFYEILDPDGREILSYHWHPEASGPDHPHLHLSGRLPPFDLGPRFAPVALGAVHVATGQVAFGAVVRMLIEEFGVAPRRADWRGVVAAVGR